MKTWASEPFTKRLADINEEDVLREDYRTLQKLDSEFPGSIEAILVASAITQFENISVHADFLKKAGSNVERATWNLVTEGYLNTCLLVSIPGRYFYLWDNKDGDWWLRAIGFGREGIRGDPVGGAFASDYTRKTILDYFRTRPLLPNVYHLLSCLSKEGKAELALSALEDEDVFASIESDIFAQKGLASARKLGSVLSYAASRKEQQATPELASKLAILLTHWVDSLDEVSINSLQGMGVRSLANFVNLSSKILKNTRPSDISHLFEITGTVLLRKISMLNSFREFAAVIVALYEADADRMIRYLSTAEVQRKVAKIANSTPLNGLGVCFYNMPRQLRKKIASFLIPKEFASKVGESSAGGVWRFFRYSEDLGFKIKFLKAVSESDFCAMITRSSAENITRLLRRFNLATSVAIRQEGERLTSYLDLEKVQFLIGGTDTEGKNKLFSSIALCNNSVARALLKKGLGKEIMCNSTPHDLSLILGHLVEDERLLPVAKDFLSNVCANDWKEKLISASDAGVFWLIWHIYQTDQDLGRKLVQNTYEHLLSLIDIMDAERVGLFGLLVLCEVSIAPYLLSGEHLWSLMNMLKQVKSSTCFFLGLELLKRNLPLPKASGVEEWLVVKADSMAEKLDEAYLVQSMKTRFLEIIKELKAI